MYRDRKGHVWFGTGIFGICRFDGQSLDWMYEGHLTECEGGGWFGKGMFETGYTAEVFRAAAASVWQATGEVLRLIVDEFWKLPLKREVLPKILYQNAMRIFGLENDPTFKKMYPA